MFGMPYSVRFGFDLEAEEQHLSTKPYLAILGFAILGVLQFTAPTIEADVRIRYVSQSPSYEVATLTMPASTDTVTLWISGGLGRIDAVNNISLLYNARSQTSDLLLHSECCHMRSMPRGSRVSVSGSIDSTTLVEEDLREQFPKSRSDLTATDSVKEIRGFNCRKYVINEEVGGSFSGSNEIWATEGIDVDTGVIHGLMYNPFFITIYSWAQSDLRRIKGVIVLCTSRAQDDFPESADWETQNIFELLDITKMDAPDGYLDLPSNYCPCPRNSSE
jgi:hypothetical protein